jgi:hypothetical protein
MEGLDKYLTNEPMTNDKWDGLYNIVYADPAWKFGSRLANGNDKNGIVNLKQVKIGDNYTVMTTDDICRLPVKNIKMKPCRERMLGQRGVLKNILN